MNQDYKNWIVEVKQKIRSSQIKAAIAVNTALIEFYWDLGKMISEKENIWGSKLLEKISRDLKEEFPDMRGFSRINLFYCKQFYLFYKNQFVQQPVEQIHISDDESSMISQQPVDQLGNPEETRHDRVFKQLIVKIPWGHNIQIFTKSKNISEALFYIQKTLVNNWSRDVLALQIKSELYLRQGKAITNFKSTLPSPDSDLAQQTLKDPYIFDFFQLSDDYKERDLENQLTEHVTRFLLELGRGFAFVGKQYRVELGEKEYFIDLLFYHILMKCYVVVELKNRDFEPEYAGKLNFYLTLIDKTLKRHSENPTIGILLCRGKDNLEVEYALQDIHKPMGVSEFKLGEVLPENLKSSLPSIEELEEELRKLD
jgi:predicted nuclease of restriction endonuclease-like (RecB) superfamily